MISEEGNPKKDDVGSVVVAVSGYFDPLHVGHIEYMKKAKSLAGGKGNCRLVVILNNDQQAVIKKGYYFMPTHERKIILESLHFVDEVVLSVDDDKSVCKSLELVKPHIFAKGGDRSIGEIPETPVCKKLGIEVIDGLGDKIQSSSDLVKRSREINNK